MAAQHYQMRQHVNTNKTKQKKTASITSIPVGRIKETPRTKPELESSMVYEIIPLTA
jgi:hypothetical protein